jgi:short-subunit dehydrogenase
MAYALVTGASKGIGKGIAEELAKRGYSILLVARSGEALEKIATDLQSKYKIEAKYLTMDLGTPGSAKAIVDWCRENNFLVNVLVNNAGYGLSGEFEKYPLKDHLDMMQLNMQVPVELCYSFLPQLKKQERSYILNISSTSAYQAIPLMSVYAASKVFILSFTRGLRQELKGTSISVTCISPGPTDSEFVVRARIKEKGLKAAKKVNMTPEAVAAIAVRAMLAGKAEVITGILNKLAGFASWLLPKGFIERTAMKMYE